MVASIMLTGTYNIGISSTNKIKTPDGNTVELKDIPFVRYRFDHYGETELDFIKENKKRFPCVHIVELTLGKNTVELIDTLASIDETIAVIVYVDVTDEIVKNRAFSDETVDLLEDVAGCEFERLNLRDKSSSLFNADLDALKKELKAITGIREDDIGVCGGPMCFINGNACLTAVKAREILANCSDRDDVVVPSANHEGKLGADDALATSVNKCGCIRYFVYNSDMEAPASKSPGGTKKIKVKTNGEDKEITKETVENKEKAAKTKVKGYTKVNW